MTERRKEISTLVGSQAFFVMLGYCFTFVVGFPLQIFLARSLGANDIGLFSLIEGVVGIAVGLMGFGVAATLVKFIPGHVAHREFAVVRRLIVGSAVFLTASGCCGAILMIAGSGQIANLIGGDVAYESLPKFVAIAALLVPLGLLLHLFQQALRGFFDLRYAMIGSSIIQLSVKAVVAVVLISLGLKLLGLLLAVIAAQFLAIIWMAYGVWKKQNALPENESREISNSQALWRAYAGNQYKRSLVTLAVGYLDRFLLGILAGPASVGVLAVVQQLQTLPAVCLEMLLTIVAPVFSSAHAREQPDEAYHIFRLTTDWVVRASAPIVIFFIVFSAPVLGMYGETFATLGALSLCVVMIGQLINLCVGPSTTYLNMCGREREFLNIHIGAQVVYVAFLAGLVPWLGLLGAVIARVSSSLFANLAALYIAIHRLHLKWWDERYFKWLLPLVVTGVAAVLMRMALEPGLGPAALLGVLASLLLIFHLTFAAQGLSDEDKALFQALITRFGWQHS